MRTRQKCVATDTWRSLGCRTTPLEHRSRRKPTVEPRWAKQQTKKLRPKPTKITIFINLKCTRSIINKDFKILNHFQRFHIRRTIFHENIMNLTSSQSLNIGGRRGTTDDIGTIPFHPPCLPLPSGNLQTLFPFIP